MVAVMIRLPPADPVARYSVPFERNSAIVGEMDERGLLPGRMKLEGDGTYPKALDWLGMEKSFISSFMMTPVSGTHICDLSRVSS